MKDYSELKKLAEAATQGEWRHDTKSGKIGAVEVDGYDIVQVQSRRRFDHASRNADAAFIAGANPAAVLELISEVESLKKDAARYRWLRDESIDPGSVIDKKIGHSYVGDYPIYEYRAGQELDDAIDAEMIEVNNK